LIEAKYPGSILWECLLRDILEYGVLNRYTLGLRLGEVHRETCLSDRKSCKENMQKLQALLLAANLSEIEDSGELIGDFLRSIGIILDDSNELKQSEIIGVPRGWKISFPDIFVPKQPGERPNVFHLRFIDYTYLGHVLPTTFDHKLHCCKLCISRWCFEKRSRWMFFASFSLCPVCKIYKVPNDKVADTVRSKKWSKVIGLFSSLSNLKIFKVLNNRGSDAANSHVLIDIPLSSGNSQQLLTDLFPQRDRERAGTF
jgi:hypothetical protein